MDVERFYAILPLIVSAVTEKIASYYHLDENTAIEQFYASKLYTYLEDEKTKVWQYSADKLFDLYKTETETGVLTLPEY